MVDNKILIIEDDISTVLFMKEFLEDCNFNIDIFSTVTDAISNIKFNKYDIILLDLNLPDFNGIEILKFLNKNNLSIPTIVISAHSDMQTKLQAFKYGASDYITKPINLKELEARIWVHLNKNTHFELKKDIDIFKIDNDKILFKQEHIIFTKIETDIVLILIRNRNNLVTRDSLSKQLSSKSNERALDYHIRNIRNKIEDNSSNPKYLITEYGIGYKLLY